MRRPLRRLSTLAAVAASAVLCAAVCVVWVRSYWYSEEVSWRGDRGWRSVRSATGYVEIGLLAADWSSRPDLFHGPKYGRTEAGPPVNWLQELGGSVGDTDSDWEWHGFAWHEKRNARRDTWCAEGYAPFWAPAAVTAALPVGWAGLWCRSRVRTRRRRASGRCPACGYDLRASPGRCPECGAVPVAIGAGGREGAA